MNIKLIALIGAAGLLNACAVAKTTGKIAALPVKGVYYTGKGAGTAVIKTGELASKGVYYTGKGAYHTAKVPVNITNAALDTSIKVLTVTTQVVDLSGKVVTVSRTMQRSEVDGYVAQAKGAANVLSVLVDIYRG